MRKLVKLLNITLQIAFLYVLSLLGGIIVEFLHVPLPGSIIGLIILLLLLHMKIVKKEYVADGAGFLLPILTLLFIPATVGVVNYPELLSWLGVSLLIITIISTIFSLGVTAKFAQKLEQTERQKEEVEVYAPND
ncbi:MAG: CidA/LrgA family protein [Kurthia gibsonii]|uniref:CidA/LrgA family protein n=1 Tax=Kurthia gibsonii TaxID=33946 RepID=A0ABU9LJ97_9BACL|nr:MULTISPECIES: CidA/LrgA family protein [Kurthia]AMA64391.1 lrgA family protein [Kurthia sp. 11kri321]MEB7771640.1 CidA/LrgA family protein [Kurthia gibsonii]